MLSSSQLLDVGAEILALGRRAGCRQSAAGMAAALKPAAAAMAGSCCSSSVRRVGKLHRSLMTKPVDVQVVCAQRQRVSPMPAAPGALSPAGAEPEWRGSIAGQPAAEPEQAAPKSQAWLGAGCGGGGVVRTEHLVRAGGRGSDNGENAGRGRAAT